MPQLFIYSTFGLGGGGGSRRGGSGLSESNNPLLQSGGTGAWDPTEYIYEWLNGDVDQERYGNSLFNFQNNIYNQIDDGVRPSYWRVTASTAPGETVSINGVNYTTTPTCIVSAKKTFFNGKGSFASVKTHPWEDMLFGPSNSDANPYMFTHEEMDRGGDFMLQAGLFVAFSGIGIELTAARVGLFAIGFNPGSGFADFGIQMMTAGSVKKINITEVLANTFLSNPISAAVVSAFLPVSWNNPELIFTQSLSNRLIAANAGMIGNSIGFFGSSHLFRNDVIDYATRQTFEGAIYSHTNLGAFGLYNLFGGH
jgi:hypothetical protein